MTTLYAQPYDITATGFYFDSSDDFDEKSAALRNEHGDPVEEYELQWIDGEDIDSDLAKSWDINQVSLAHFLDAVDNWDQHQKRSFIIAVGECGYPYNPASDHPNDFDVDIYELDSMKDLAEHFLDEGLYGDIPESLEMYIDTDAIARDLSVEYSEISIAGTNLVYACR